MNPDNDRSAADAPASPESARKTHLYNELARSRLELRDAIERYTATADSNLAALALAADAIALLAGAVAGFATLASRNS